MPVDDVWFHILLFVIAVISNLLSAIAGGGAGLIQLPVIIFLGLPFAVALATHKVASVALGIGASIKHLKASTLQLPVSSAWGGKPTMDPANPAGRPLVARESTAQLHLPPSSPPQEKINIRTNKYVNFFIL